MLTPRAVDVTRLAVDKAHACSDAFSPGSSDWLALAAPAITAEY
jgi:hypothetical protein